MSPFYVGPQWTDCACAHSEAAECLYLRTTPFQFDDEASDDECCCSCHAQVAEEEL
jgi:hypothetical protein